MEQSLLKKKKRKRKKDKINPNTGVRCDLQGETLKMAYINNEDYLIINTVVCLQKVFCLLQGNQWEGSSDVVRNLLRKWVVP